MKDTVDKSEDDLGNKNNEPRWEPECDIGSCLTEEELKNKIKCKFENRDGSWWCTTHNCWA